jgi:Uma2 family endonuclease
MNPAIDEPRPFRFDRDQYYHMSDLGWFRDQKVELIGGHVLVHPGPETEPPGPDMFPSRRWTRNEYYQMLDFGWFRDRRVELIDGEIIEMPAQKNYHGAALTLTADVLRVVFGVGFWVRVQLSLDLSPWSVPDPDVAVVSGSPRGVNAATANPTTALLVVEVSDTSLSHDRNAKGSLFAVARIEDYWIVNLVQRQLEVYRDPIPDPNAPFGARYATRLILDPVDHVTPLAAPGAAILVADLLP